jgi:hypothetical protein
MTVAEKEFPGARGGLDRVSRHPPPLGGSKVTAHAGLGRPATRASRDRSQCGRSKRQFETARDQGTDNPPSRRRR